MQRIRAARTIAEHFRKEDPESRISESLIRRLMDDGELPTFRSGSRRLTSIEAVEAYLQRQLGGADGKRKT